MKNLFPKLAALTVAVALSIFCMTSCSVEDLTKDLTVYTSNSFLVSPLSIQVGDAAHLESYPADLTVSIEGRDKAKIFSTMGESTIHPLSGIVVLTVKTTDEPTPANPLEFTLVLSAPNYVTVRKSYVLTSKSELSTDKVAMVNLTATPDGVSIQNTSFASTTSGTEKAFVFASPLSAGKTEQTSVTINAGTQALAADGAVLSGTIQTQLVHYDARSEASLSGLPEGFGNMTLKTSNGTTKMSMVPAGFYSMSMTVGGKEVSRFSTPLDITVDIDPACYNSLQNRKIQVGDVLDVMSRTETETAWTAETKATVISVNGQLKARFKQPHLSFWVYGFSTKFEDLCFNKTITVTSDFFTVPSTTDCSARTLYNYKVVNANNPSIVYTAGSSYFIDAVPLDQMVFGDKLIKTQVVISTPDNVVVYTSPPQSFCENSNLDLRGKLSATNSIVARLNVSAYCAGNVNSVFVPDGISLWYRDMSSPANTPFGGWGPLVVISNGKACARGLLAGHNYDFALPFFTQAGQFGLVSFSKELKQPNGCPIPLSGDINVSINSPVYNVFRTLNIKKLPDGVYDMTFENYELPANICAELNKKYQGFFKPK